MEYLMQFVRDYDVYFLLGLVLLVIILFIILIYTNSVLSKLDRKYRRFMKGGKDKNIEELLTELLRRVDESDAKAEGIKSMYGTMQDRLDTCVQKVSMMRYKAFDNLGSSQSFSIVMLNANNDGVILTSIYGRDECATYAKSVERGVPKYELSEEEEQVLKDAISKKIYVQ